MATSVSPATSMTVNQRLRIQEQAELRILQRSIPPPKLCTWRIYKSLPFPSQRISTRPRSLGLRQTQYMRLALSVNTSACVYRHFPLSENVQHSTSRSGKIPTG